MKSWSRVVLLLLLLVSLGTSSTRKGEAGKWACCVIDELGLPGYLEEQLEGTGQKPFFFYAQALSQSPSQPSLYGFTVVLYPLELHRRGSPDQVC